MQKTRKLQTSGEIAPYSPSFAGYLAKNEYNTIMNSALEKYRQLRQQTDARVAALNELHEEYLTCRAGCYECCVDLSVFPVEYYAILEDLRRNGLTKLTFDEHQECGFLREGLCALYPYRPLICRTHGLPIAFLDGDFAEEISVSFCPKNFADEDPQWLEFGPENTLDLEALNAELFSINLAYLQEHLDNGWEPTNRIPLKQLLDDLADQPR